MEITKKLKITEVKATNISNAPFQIISHNPIDGDEKDSSLMIDEETFVKYKIPREFGLVGKVLTCLFVSRESKERFSDRNSLEIKSIEKKEITSLLPHAIPASKAEKVTIKLILSTQGGYGRFSAILCPFFKFSLDLTEEEYVLCKNLSPETEFELKNLSVNDE